MIGGENADGGDGIASLIAQAEEDVDDCIDWVGYRGIRMEVGDGLAADSILLIVGGDDNLCGMAEMLGGGVPGEEKVSDEEHKVHERPELDRLAVAGVLRVFAGP